MSEDRVTYLHTEPRIKVKGRRTDLGLTASQLGVIVGLSQSRMSRIENGKREATVWEAMRIARALRCKVEDLFIEP